jgi:hypothetical protein
MVAADGLERRVLLSATLAVPALRERARRIGSCRGPTRGGRDAHRGVARLCAPLVLSAPHEVDERAR